MAKREQVRQVQDAIRTVLFHDWDPIGVREVAPEDEYDSYIGGVYRILTSSRSEKELVAYLAKVEMEYMGLKHSKHESKWRKRLKQVAHKLLRLDVEDYALAHSKKFQRSLSASYREYRRKGGAVSLKTLMTQTKREPARRARKKGTVRPSTSSGRTVSRNR